MRFGRRWRFLCWAWWRRVPNGADASSTTRDVLVIATAATVESHAYASACADRKLRVIEKACPLLVPLVEEGWIESPVTAEVLRIYMAELMEQARGAGLDADTLVLGCTHYPLLRTQIEKAVPATLQGDRFSGGNGGASGADAEAGS
jgi:glutamate racemase